MGSPLDIEGPAVRHIMDGRPLFEALIARRHRLRQRHAPRSRQPRARHLTPARAVTAGRASS